MQLQLATTRAFNGVTLNCYIEDKPKEDFDFFATREQIGAFLGYRNPDDSIAKIHRRNKERLDPLSRVDILSRVEGNRTVTRSATIYSFRGLLEICRFSNQPNANKVIDILWNIAEEIKRKGYYVAPTLQDQFDAVVAENKLLRDDNKRLTEENIRLQSELNEGRTFRLLGEAVALMPGAMTIREAALALAQHGIEVGQNRAFKTCRDYKMLCSRKGVQRNQPTQLAINKGYFTIQLNIGAKGTPMITPKGVQWLAGIYSADQYPLLALVDEADNNDGLIRKQA